MIVGLFAGPGGWDQAAVELGHRPIGIETDEAACATRRAAGHLTIRADVAAYPIDHLTGRVDGVIASPPCKAFSRAGKRHGHELIGDLCQAIVAGEWGARPHPDPLVWLVLEPGRWIETLRPEWVAMEQVPDCLPLWQAYVAWLTRQGYHATCGVLSSEAYGVPQVRKRAILVASRLSRVSLPAPTHQAYRAGEPAGERATIFGRLAPWVSMGEALDTALDTHRDQREDGATQVRSCGEPAPTLTGKSVGQWKLNPGRTHAQPNRRARPLDEPAPTIAFGHDLARWCWERPATTVTSTPRIAKPGHRDREGGERHWADAVPVTVPQAGVLQGFPAGYPWQGTKTAQARQVGDAVPPPDGQGDPRRPDHPIR